MVSSTSAGRLPVELNGLETLSRLRLCSRRLDLNSSCRLSIVRDCVGVEGGRNGITSTVQCSTFAPSLLKFDDEV